MIERAFYWLEKAGEWFARALVAVGAGYVAFSLVPWILNATSPSFRMVEILACAFALHQVSGFFMRAVCQWCRISLAAVLAVALFTRWMSLPVSVVAGRIALAFVVWTCFSLIIDVLEIPHADYLRDRLATIRSLGHA